jgi:hypothetical protein
MKNLKIAAGASFLFILLVTPVLSMAQMPGPTNLPAGVPHPINITGDATTIYKILGNVINIAFIILMLLAVLFVIWAAFKYLTSGGNPENVEIAQRMLMYAVIAIVIGLLAESVPMIVGTFVQNNVTSGNGSAPCPGQYGPQLSGQGC